MARAGELVIERWNDTYANGTFRRTAGTNESCGIVLQADQISAQEGPWVGITHHGNSTDTSLSTKEWEVAGVSLIRVVDSTEHQDMGEGAVALASKIVDKFTGYGAQFQALQPAGADAINLTMQVDSPPRIETLEIKEDCKFHAIVVVEWLGSGTRGADS